MSRQLWATYSVKDHLQPRTLATDIILFDKLVFPVPETGFFPENSGSPTESGPVEWVRNQEEWARWKNNAWDPLAQERLLRLLSPVVRKVSWDSKVSGSVYRREAAKLAAQGLPDYAFVATRTLLTRDLPAYVDGVAALGPAYRDVDGIEHDLGIGKPSAKRVLDKGVLPLVLAWEFFAPDPADERLSDEELLRETVDFTTGDEQFRKRRTAFIEWQQKFLRDDTTDVESIKHAVAEMRQLLEDAKAAANKLTIRKVARYAFQIAPSAIGLAAAFVGMPDGVALASGGVFLSAGSIAVDELVFKSSEGPSPVLAAFVHDARRHFGWRAAS